MYPKHTFFIVFVVVWKRQKNGKNETKMNKMPWISME